jgi:hypothetical protein
VKGWKRKIMSFNEEALLEITYRRPTSRKAVRYVIGKCPRCRISAELVEYNGSILRSSSNVSVAFKKVEHYFICTECYADLIYEERNWFIELSGFQSSFLLQ